MDDTKQKTTLPIEQVLEAQFAKVGRLQFEIDILRQQMTMLEAENNRLKASQK